VFVVVDGWAGPLGARCHFWVCFCIFFFPNLFLFGVLKEPIHIPPKQKRILVCDFLVGVFLGFLCVLPPPLAPQFFLGVFGVWGFPPIFVFG